MYCFLSFQVTSLVPRSLLRPFVLEAGQEIAAVVAAVVAVAVEVGGERGQRRGSLATRVPLAPRVEVAQVERTTKVRVCAQYVGVFPREAQCCN